MSGLPLLAIDTSGPWLQLGLARDGHAPLIHFEPLSKGHAELLFDRIAELLTRAGLGYGDLRALVTTLGPGSFTGLRIGISAARGLGLALDVPVIGVANLFALSLSATGLPRTIRLDARRGEHYAQAFSAAGVAQSEAGIFPVADDMVFDDPKVDMAALCAYAQTADPLTHLPDPVYLRAADAKPQTRNLIERAPS